MTPSREMVEEAKRVKGKYRKLDLFHGCEELEIADKVFDALAELYLSASESMPEKRNNTADNQHKGDLGQEYADSGFNEAIDQIAPLVMRLQGRVEELERMIKGWENGESTQKHEMSDAESTAWDEGSHQ